MDFTKLKPPECANCPLYHSPGPVWGEGNPRTAQLIYIAQNPGEREVGPLYHGLPGQPLIGPSGNVFNRQLFETGIPRHDLYITNQVKCLTPGNREPSPAEVGCCRHILAAELQACKADTVVLAGAVAFTANVGSYSTLGPSYHPRNKRGQDIGIMGRMGCVEQRDGRKWIGTIHPAHVMRMPEMRAKALDHLRKAWSVAGVKIPLPEVEIYPPDDFIPYMIEEINKYGEFADDAEAVGMEDVEEDDYVGADFKLTMLGIGYAPYKAAIFRPDQIHLLQPIFENPRLWRDEHNGPYDQYHIEKFISVEYFKASCFDTMQGHHFLRSYDEKYLKPNVLSTYTNLPYYGRDLGDINEPFYCGMDNIATYLAAREQRRQLESWGMLELFLEYGQRILPPLEEWRRVGINTDVKKVLFFRRVIQNKIDRATVMIAKLCGPMFNWDSPKQVNEFLYTLHGLPKQYNKKKVGGQIVQSLTSDYEARKRLKHWIETKGESTGKHKTAYLFLTLADYVSGEQQKLQFLDRVSPDGRIHAFFKGHGTSFFRLSSKPNVQNFPVYDIMDWGGARAAQDKEERVDPAGLEKKRYGSLRSIVVPDVPEDWLVSCDYNQLQLWIMAALFNVKWLLDINKSGNYIYGDIYEKLYAPDRFFEDGKPHTKAFKRKDVPEQRIRRAKAVPLGFLFNRSGEAVAEEYGWPVAEGNKLRRWWFDNVPELEQAYPKIEYQMKQKGYIRHAFGQIIWYPSLKSSEAINSHAQSQEAFIMRGTIVRIHEGLRKRWGPYHPVKNRNRIVLSVHDSLTFNLMDHCVEEAVETIIIPAFKRPIPQLGGFAFSCSCEIGKMWDWETEDYDKWKLGRGGEAPPAGTAGDQSIGRSSSPQEQPHILQSS